MSIPHCNGTVQCPQNISKQSDAIPFVVVVQSSLYDDYSRRVVVPLVRRSTLARTAGFLDTPLNPVFTVKGIKVVLHPLEMVSVALENLGEKIATLYGRKRCDCCSDG